MSFLRVIRPGSRVVLVGLTPIDAVLALGQHGCRLTLVGATPAIEECRHRLQGMGLRSQLMGSQNRVAALPEDYYEAVLVLEPELGTPEQWLRPIRPDGVLVASGVAPSDWKVERTHLPEGFWSYWPAQSGLSGEAQQS